ncbi:MAG: glycosyltransferase family 4 protein [Vicinamibacterales bacterium]
MNVLYLTNNAQLAGTTRILLSWLKFGREQHIGGCVVVPAKGALSNRLETLGTPWTTNAMPWPSGRIPLQALRQAWHVSRWARRHDVELVHCNEHDTYPFGVLVAALMRVPVVCHVRFSVDRQFCEWAFGGWRRPGALLWTTNQQRLDCVDAIGGVVPDERQHVIRLGPDREVFSAKPADRLAFRRQFDIRDDELAIGTATALRPIKRIEDFVTLIEALAERHPNVVGLIAGGAVAGDEAYRELIEQRISKSGLGRRLRWLGHLDQVEPLMGSLDIFVSTSEYETFGNSVCEAMACGLPTVGYVGGSIHEVIGDAGIVVANGDVQTLITSVDSLVTDEASRRRLGAQGQKRVETEFNPAVSFRALRAIYERLIAGAR